MQLAPLLQKLADDLEMGQAPQPETSGVYPVKISPELQVAISPLDPGCSFHAQIGALPQQKKEELLVYLMKANFLGQGTGGAVIGLDGDEKFLTLSFLIPYDMDYKAFKSALEDFVNHVAYWKEEVARYLISE